MVTRELWLAERRRIAEERFDGFAPTCDADWGDITESHAVLVRRTVDSCPAGGVLLDAASGTGKYWPLIRAAGRRVVGVDHSAGMLQGTTEKFPVVEVHKARLHEIDFDGRFDAVICVDALENIFPEDWPAVVGRLCRAAKSGALLYLTVELAEDGGHVQSRGPGSRPSRQGGGIRAHHEEARLSSPVAVKWRPMITDEERQQRLLDLNELIELLRPAVQADGGDLMLVEADVEHGLIEVRLQGACSSCAVSATTLKAGIDRILKDRLPWVTEVAGDVDDEMDFETSYAMGRGGYVPRDAS